MNRQLRSTQRTRVGSLILLLAILFTTISMQITPGAAQALDGDAALVRDARMYASDHGLGLREAVHRLQLQRAAGHLDAQLAKNERATFGGLWIQHTPRFRVVVRFTRSGRQTVRPYIQDGPLASLVEVRTGGVSLATLEATQAEQSRNARRLGIRVDSRINVSENRVEIEVTDRSRLDAGLRAATLRLPSHVAVNTVPQLSEPTVIIYAGLGLSGGCTSGFSIVPNTSGAGILTAAHCPNDESYAGYSLPFKAERYYGSYDIQWHTWTGGSVFDVKPRAKDNSVTGYRYVTGSRHRDNQAVGEYVCKYGNTTRFNCGYIISKTLNPSYVPNGSATFIVVRRENVDLSNPGDSGGPWYSGGTAFGIMSGHSGNDGIYMAVNYAFDLGVRLLTCTSGGSGC